MDFRVEEIVTEHTPSTVRYRFTVQDTGIGMSEEFLKHIFEPFTREQAAERIEGTGLGLSIAKRLVDLMGGTISVESGINQGTRFIVELERQNKPWLRIRTAGKRPIRKWQVSFMDAIF